MVHMADADRKFLAWIRDRMEFVHGDDPLVDYMHKLKALATPTCEAWCGVRCGSGEGAECFPVPGKSCFCTPACRDAGHPQHPRSTP